MERGKLTIKEAEIEIETEDLLTYLKDVVDLVDGIIVELKSIIEAKEAQKDETCQP